MAAFGRWGHLVTGEVFKLGVKAFLNQLPPEQIPDNLYVLTKLPAALHETRMSWSSNQDGYKYAYYYQTANLLKMINDGKTNPKTVIPKFGPADLKKMAEAGYPPILDLPENVRHKYLPR